jgi:hypothetical protein
MIAGGFPLAVIFAKRRQFLSIVLPMLLQAEQKARPGLLLRWPRLLVVSFEGKWENWRAVARVPAVVLAFLLYKVYDDRRSQKGLFRSSLSLFSLTNEHLYLLFVHSYS